jgi:hypothetical protein
MGALATRQLSAAQARLAADAEEAGRSLACVHQSADELHGALIGRYLTLRASRRAAGTGWIVAAALLVMVLLFS